VKEGYLVLETGEVFVGELLGESTSGAREVVFDTRMIGFDELIGDACYAGQIVVFSYPLVRLGKVNKTCLEAIVVDELIGSEELDVPVLIGVDTRDIMRKVRKYGSVKGFVTDSLDRKRDLLREVSCKTNVSVLMG